MTETLQSEIRRINELKRQVDTLKPMKPEYEARWWKKIRLEWNYNSNHIEGNTLSYGETELLLMFDQTIGNHLLRELEEMKSHDTIIHLVKGYAEDRSRELTEADIRQWNKTILVRPFWKDAITQEGHATKKLIEPGAYKTTPNSVRLSNGEIFHYASPEETPALMQELLEWYHDERKKNALHPVELAALFHYKFVRIHPFDDSNGRTARLIMNYVLMRYSYPPVIIRSNEKREYLAALNQADVGFLDGFVTYIAKELSRSLELTVRAAQGENIEDSDDHIKEIDIWKRQLKGIDEAKLKSLDFVKQCIEKLVKPSIERFVADYRVFHDLFLESQVFVELVTVGQQKKVNLGFDQIGLEPLESVLQEFTNQVSATFDDSIIVFFKFKDFKPKLEASLNYHFRYTFFFAHKYYVVEGSKPGSRRPYSQPLLKEEINELAKGDIQSLFEELKKYTAL